MAPIRLLVIVQKWRVQWSCLNKLSITSNNRLGVHMNSQSCDSVSKTCANSRQIEHSTELRLDTKSHPWQRNYWQLIAAWRGRIICKGLTPGRLIMLQRMFQHPWVLGQHKFDSVDLKKREGGQEFRFCREVAVHLGVSEEKDCGQNTMHDPLKELTKILFLIMHSFKVN